MSTISATPRLSSNTSPNTDVMPSGVDEQRQARQWLLRTIRNQGGEFALIIVLCNSIPEQHRQIKLLRREFAGNLPELKLQPTAQTLCSAIRHQRSNLNPGHPQALMVTGLDKVEALDDLLAATNNAVNALVRNIPHPLVLWMDNRAFRRLVRCAPDLANRAPAAIRFRDAPGKGVCPMPFK